MKIPKGLTEQQVLDTIENVSTRLANKFKFGYHGTEDMKQQAALIAIKSLDKWDGVRPLENFLYTCVHNLLYNNKRDNYERPDKPCFTCPLYDKHCIVSINQCSKFEDKMDCELYSKWYLRNTAKKNIMRPIDIGNVQDEHEKNMRSGDHIAELEKTELWALIDKHLDIKLRGDYIKLRNNIKISKARRFEIEQAVLEITKQFYKLDDIDD